MDNYSSRPNREGSLWRYIINSKKNKIYVLTALTAAILQFIIFKFLYPYADFFSDSYSYIYAAYTGADTNIWPIGYSKFLCYFHMLSSSDTVLVSFQYFFLILSCLSFFYTIVYLYRPGPTVSTTLYIFLFFNPLFLYLSNYVSSDALFLGVSLFWLVQLLWIIHHPAPHQVWIHGLLLIVAFTLRYNAMYYPLVSLGAFMLSMHTRAAKIAGVAFGVILIVTFILYSRQKNYQLTGVRQFSIFSGWQLANNALYMYPHVAAEEREVPPICRDLDVLTRTYFKEVDSSLKFQSPAEGAFYIRHPEAPLKQYLIQYLKKDTLANDVKGWGVVAPTFATYGTFLIKHYPAAFSRYYLLPNMVNYLIPPLEKLEIYNVGMDEVYPPAAVWFGYGDIKIWSVSKYLQGILLFIFPILFTMSNIFYAGCFILLVYSGKLKTMSHFPLIAILLNTIFLVLNFLFSVLASPIVFRYQVLPLILCFTFSLIILEQLLQKKQLS